MREEAARPQDVAHCHFHSILLVKVSNRVSTDSRDGKIDSLILDKKSYEMLWSLFAIFH